MLVFLAKKLPDSSHGTLKKYFHKFVTWHRWRERDREGESGVSESEARGLREAKRWKKERLKLRLGSRKRRPKRCSFGISGTRPKSVQPLRFAIFTVKPPVFGFCLFFLNFRFFWSTEPNKVLVPGWTGRSDPVFKTMEISTPFYLVH